MGFLDDFFGGGSKTTTTNRLGKSSDLFGPGRDFTRLFRGLSTDPANRNRKDAAFINEILRAFGGQISESDLFLAPTSGTERGRRVAFEEVGQFENALNNLASSFGPGYAALLGSTLPSADRAAELTKKTVGDFDDRLDSFISDLRGRFGNARKSGRKAINANFDETVRNAQLDLEKSLRQRGMSSSSLRENTIANRIIPRALAGKLSALSDLETGISSQENSAVSGLMNTALANRSALAGAGLSSSLGFLNPELSRSLLGDLANLDSAGARARFGALAQPSAIFAGIPNGVQSQQSGGTFAGGLGAVAGNLAGSATNSFFGSLFD